MTIVSLHPPATYALLTLGTFGMWLGEPEGTFPYPILSLVAGILAYFLTDRAQRWVLPQEWNNGIAMVLLVLGWVEIRREVAVALNALGHFLVYLQLVKIFRIKTQTDYWHLYILSLLQLCIGCVTNRQLGFGVVMIGYAVLAMGLICLSTLREQLEQPDGESAPVESKNLPNRGDKQGETALLNRPAFAGAALGWWWILAVWSVPMALMVFLFLPRQSRPNMGVEAASERAITGFSGRVGLDELSTVMEGDEVVFQAWVRSRDGRAATLPDDLLWRGMVFAEYNQGQWRAVSELGSHATRTWDREHVIEPNQLEIRVEQKIRTGRVLFYPRPLVWARALDDGTVTFLRHEGRLIYTRRGTLTDRNDLAPSYLIHIGALDAPVDTDAPPSPRYLNHCLQLPSYLARLKEEGERIVADIPPGDTMARILRIQDYLTRGDEFEYTLEPSPPPEGVDPIEHFLFERKAGHCEYYASTATLLLRSAGVSTRLINGFKGADYNAAGGYYQVRQLLAHSWLEAYLPEKESWITVDPTPTDGRAQQVAERRSRYQYLNDMREAATHLWSNYIVGLDAQGRQQILQGIRQLPQRLLDNLRAWWNVLRRPAWNASTLIAWGGVLATVFWGIRLARGGWQRWTHFWRGAGAKLGPSGFPLYDRWVTLLARRGFARLPHQTPLEFAEELAQRWRDQPDLEVWANLPARIVNAYYAARFGNLLTHPTITQQLEREMREFARRDIPAWRVQPSIPASFSDK